jgi:hypothetical protein
MDLFHSNKVPKLTLLLPADFKQAQLTAISAHKLVQSGRLYGLKLLDPAGKPLEVRPGQSSAEIAQQVRSRLGCDATRVDYRGETTIEEAFKELHVFAEGLGRDLLVNLNGIVMPFGEFVEFQDFSERFLDELKLQPLSNGSRLIACPLTGTLADAQNTAVTAAKIVGVSVLFPFSHSRGKELNPFWTAHPGESAARIRLASRALRREAASLLSEV